MKILYLATYDMTVPGTGSSIRGAFFLRHLAEEYEVHLLYMEGFGHDPGKSGIKLKACVPEEIKSVSRVPYSDKGFFLYEPKLYRRAAEIIEKEGIDLIFASFGISGLYAWALKKKYGLPYIYDSHNVEYKRYADFGKKDWRRFPLIPYVYWWESICCRNALLTLAITDGDALSFRRWTDRILTIPGGFDDSVLNPFYREPPASPPVILCVGNYNNPGNRQAVYLARERVVDQVVREHPAVRFQFVGANPPQDIEHRSIEFPGFVDNLLPYWQRANLVIVPVTEGGGMRIKTIEALACGKPVVSTPKGMEGIPPGLPGVIVRDIEDFPTAIINSLKSGRFLYREGFDRIAGLFSERALIGQLKKRIEEEMSCRNC